jgi:hypothetical protein
MEPCRVGVGKYMYDQVEVGIGIVGKFLSFKF